jgi:molecular chaperone GrpE
MAADNTQDDMVFEPEDNSGLKRRANPNTDTDDEFVEEDGEGNTGNTQDTVKKLREKLKKAIEEKQEYLNGWQRAKADFVNARKRDDEAKKEVIKFASEDIIAQLIPVLESFEMARANKAAWESIDKNWRMGMEHIHSQLLGILQSNGLEELNPLGQKFDPMRDEAIAHEQVADERHDHIILDVAQKGYSLNGKIIKAPRVRVGEYQKSE